MVLQQNLQDTELLSLRIQDMVPLLLIQDTIPQLLNLQVDTIPQLLNLQVDTMLPPL